MQTMLMQWAASRRRLPVSWVRTEQFHGAVAASLSGTPAGGYVADACAGSGSSGAPTHNVDTTHVSAVSAPSSGFDATRLPAVSNPSIKTLATVAYDATTGLRCPRPPV